MPAESVLVLVDRASAGCSRAVDRLSDIGEVVEPDLLTDADSEFYDRYDIPNEGRGQLQEVLDSELVSNVFDDLALVRLNIPLAAEQPEERSDDLSDILDRVIGPDNDAVSPLTPFGFLGHISALPTGPGGQIGGSFAPLPGEGRTFLVVDTGYLPGSPNVANVNDPLARDTHADLCSHKAPGNVPISHGEFVVSLIKGVNNTAEVHVANAFPVKTYGCWQTDEIALILATANAVNKMDFDVINFSLGGSMHTPPPARLIKLLAQLPRTTTVVASAGNYESTVGVYPAAFNGVIAVGVEDLAGDFVNWALPPHGSQSATNPPPPVPKFHGSAGVLFGDLGYKPNVTPHTAPGCGLRGYGLGKADGTFDPSKMFTWSGSSFASPLYAATLGTGIGYGDLPPGCSTPIRSIANGARVSTRRGWSAARSGL